MATYRTARPKVTKLTARIPATLQARLKRRAQKTGQSLNTTLVDALSAGLETIENRAESEYERAQRVIRESGLVEPLGPEWDRWIDQAPTMTAEEIRAAFKDLGPLSDLIIQERDELR